MRTAEAIDDLLKAYLAKYPLAAKDKLKEGLRKMRDVFGVIEGRKQLAEIVHVMLQPTGEEVFVKRTNLLPAADNGKSWIAINTKTGMGLELPVEKHLAILDFIDSEVRPQAFGQAFVKRINVELKRLKG